MKSLISVNFAGYILLENVTASQNWMYEPVFSDVRAMIFYGQQL